MATFQDEGEEAQQDEEQFSSVDEIEQQPQEETPVEQEEDDIPSKYKGKSIKDVVRMHQEAEKAMGKQGSEVGELRRIVDDFVKTQTVAKQQAPDDSEEVDFFSDPEKAIARAIEKHPKIRQAEEFNERMKRTQVSSALKEAHPDFEQITKDSEFKEWITKSKVRQELFSRADSAFDFDAADELLTTWKERQQIVQQTQAVEKIERKQAVKAASTGSSRGTGESSTKIYLRSDIRDLMQKDPDRYIANADIFLQAYREGRVR